MDFCRMQDHELAEIMVNYILRVRHLCHLMAGYLDTVNSSSITSDQIKREYKLLKDELRKDANQVSLVRNQSGSRVYMRFFLPSIQEAAAFGFTVPSNASIGQQMYSAVAEAEYKLTKYYSLEEWSALL